MRRIDWQCSLSSPPATIMKSLALTPDILVDEPATQFDLHLLVLVLCASTHGTRPAPTSLLACWVALVTSTAVPGFVVVAHTTVVHVVGGERIRMGVFRKRKLREQFAVRVIVVLASRLQ
jgi:hypothetical protein